MKSSAAKKAADAQVKSTQQAQDFIRQGQGQLGQLWAPYVNSGASVMNTLGRLTTPGPGARFASPGPPNSIPMMPSGAPTQQAMPRGGVPQGYAGGPFAQMMPPQYGGYSGARMPPQQQAPPPGAYRY